MNREQLERALRLLGFSPAEAFEAADDVTKQFEFMCEGVSVSGPTNLGELTIILGPESEAKPEPIYALTIK